MPRFIPLANHKPTSLDYRRAKNLRQRPTSGEDILWYELRQATKGKEFCFRRQHPIHPYIVDFVCLKLKLIVEVDGVSHENRMDKDVKREKYLREAEYDIMRFTNYDVVNHRDSVVMEIVNRADELMKNFYTYTPLP